MKTRKWTSGQKLQIVLEGLKGQLRIGELCNKHEISQGQYYKWRDQILSSAETIFTGKIDKEKERLKRENTKLKTVIGDLTVELKKTEEQL